jgi:hypothetical protein
LFRLQNLLIYPKVNVQHAAVKALGNLALNQENQKELKVCLIFLPNQVVGRILHIFNSAYFIGALIKTAIRPFHFPVEVIFISV